MPEPGGRRDQPNSNDEIAPSHLTPRTPDRDEEEPSDLSGVPHAHSPPASSKLYAWTRQFLHQDAEASASDHHPHVPELFRFISRQEGPPEGARELFTANGNNINSNSTSNIDSNNKMAEEDHHLDLAEALSMPSFATLDGKVEAEVARRADGLGRSLLCAPSVPLTQHLAPPGIMFRMGDGNAVEAVQIIPPEMSSGEGDEEEAAVTGGGMQIIGAFPLDETLGVARMACSDDARLLLVAHTNGALECLDVLFIGGEGGVSVQFSRRWAMQMMDGGEGTVHFNTLEFLRDANTRHHFLAVAESGATSQAAWMDAASSAGTPPAVNLWPLQDGAVEDGHVTCASASPNSSYIAFGTTASTVGILPTAAGASVQYLNHPLLDPGEEDCSWKITHLHWFEPNGLAVGASRIILDPDAEDDDDEEDDPHDHQASMAIGTLTKDAPSDPSSWIWSELGDVAPFFSVPKGGQHAFHTAALPPSSDANCSMLLAGCNVASDVAILCRQQDSDKWDVLELAEGSGVACPTDEDDEFLFPTGLAAATLPLTEGDMESCRPVPLLASTDGSVTGFAPRHRSRGDAFFARLLEYDLGTVAGMGVPVPVSSTGEPSAPVAGSTPSEDSDGKCILSGLDLGLKDLKDDEDSDESSTSLDSLGSDENEAGEAAAAPEPAPSQSAFGAGFAPSSFDFDGTSTNTTPVKPLKSEGFSFGGTSGASTFGSAFGVTATTFGAASPQKPSASASPSKPMATTSTFGSTTGSGPVFGSKSTIQGGFGALASSADQTKGFGSFGKPEDKMEKEPASPPKPANVFGSSTPTAQTGFGALAAATSSNKKTFGGGAKPEDKKEDKSEATQQEPSESNDPSKGLSQPFGSGSAVPTFGSFKAGGFASFGTPGHEAKKAEASPFGAFGGTSTFGTSTMAQGMAKPLFGETKDTTATVPPSSAPTDAEKTKPSEVDASLRELLETPSGKKALDVFQSILADSEGSDSTLPTAKFESLVEEIGEGFHGDELDNQLAAVDKDGSGNITSAAFVRWYCDLVDQEGDESSQDSEKAEEKENAEKAFDELSAGAKQIPASDFGKLIESMGTTYCEEEHRRTIKKISSVDESTDDKVITRKAFVDWYVDWLFGDNESDDESVEEADATDEKPAEGGAGTSEGWGSMFKASEEGSWKCGVCMVSNKPSATSCAACETPKPGEEGKSSDAPAAAKPTASGSIGAGGFSFGGAPAADKATGGSIGAGGFSFGGFGSKPAEEKAPEATASAADGGFSFGVPSSEKAPSSTGIGSGGFSFGGLTQKMDDIASKEATKDTSVAPKSSVPQNTSSSAFPPMSKDAPKPFSTAPEKVAEKSTTTSSAAFPPMSSAAPKNPFSKKASSSTAAFPPMASAAPKPFGASAKKEKSKATEKGPSSSAFPPMSAAAPKNPFSAKPASSSAFPPMSAAAPKPFGAPPKKDAPASSNAAAFPPMSKSAPSPFGAFSKKDESKASSAAGFPPMSKAAPSPFGAFSKKEEGKEGGSAFPPMSKAAPSPFGAFTKKDGSSSSSVPSPFAAFSKTETKEGEKTPAPSGGFAFPPLSKSAPSPFGAFSKKEESKATEKASSSSAFPPMSAAAPKNPFSAKPASSSAFPPMSAAAPKPFGASAKKEESKATEKASSSSAFPPMSAAAPKNPFSAKPASSSAFPPMSAAAPKPFDASRKKEESKASDKGRSSAAFGTSMFGSAPAAPSAAVSKSDMGADPKRSNQSFSVSSRYEAELWDQVKQFAEKTSAAKRLQAEAASCIPSDLESDIESMVNKYQEKVSNADLYKDQTAAVQKRMLHLLSVQDDLDRQKKDSYLAMEEQNSEQTPSNIARKEPLDAESEKMRRSIVSKCHEVQNLMSNIDNRLELNRNIFSYSAGNEHGTTLRASDYFNQWSSAKPTRRQQTAKGATTALFKSLTGGYDKVRNFDSFVQDLSEKSKKITETHERKSQGSHQSTVKKTKIKSRLGSSRTSISPLPPGHFRSPLLSSRKKPPHSQSSIIERQQSLRKMAKDLAGEAGGLSSKTFHVRGLATHKSSTAKTNIPDWRSKGKNELFSSSKSNQTSLVPKALTSSPAVVKTLFSSPQPAARSDWNTVSECDKSNLKVNIPQKLKQINQMDAAKVALAKFGTTPEKLAEGREIIEKDAQESKAPLSSTRKSTVSREAMSSNAAFPTISSKASPQVSLPKSSAAAAFPPMPTKSPKPLSQSLKPPAMPKPESDAQKSETPVSGGDVDYKSALTKFYQEYSPAKVADVDATLQKYKGKEAEYFVSLAKRYDKPNALNEVFLDRFKGIDRTDYLAVFTLFLQIFNPSKAHGAEKYLTQHKGKEAEMFAKLSTKWGACNPLEVEMPTTTEPEAAPAKSQPQNLFAPSSEKPSASAPSPSPFASGNAPAPSPFGTGSAPAPSPFGGGSAPAPSPFGTAPAPSPSDTGAAKDYHKLMTEFYQKHNPQKVSEVPKTLEKYKGRETELFAKLAQRYKTSNPLDDQPSSSAAAPSTGSSFGFGGMSASLGASKSPFGGGGDNKSPFGSTPSVSTTSSATTAPASNTSAFGGGQSKSPFGTPAAPTESKSPFGAPAAAPIGSKSPFGAPPAAAAPSPFGSTSSGAFGTGGSLAPSPSPFGGSSGGSAFGGGAPAAATPFSSGGAFGSAPAAAGSAFGQAPAASAAPKFGGRSPRDILVSFYQTHNPSKLNDVDKVLTKYAGKEEQLFLNLAKKYNLDPSQFGVSASQPAAAAPTGGATFGSPAAMGMGGGSTGFGASSSGFGTSSGFGASSGFAAAAQGGGGGFGSLASSPAAGTFGGFGGGAPASFGSQPNPFGAARR